MTMPLSHAIRLGAMLRPQNFGGLYRETARGMLGLTTDRHTSCALGAAYEAGGIRPLTRIAEPGELLGSFRGTSVLADGGEEITFYPDPWYVFMQTVKACPECWRYAEPLFKLIPHLNDHHKWTREAIADFVETIEAQQPEPDSVAASPVTETAQ